MSRRPMIAGNWKLHHGVAASVELARAVRHRVPRGAAVDVVIAPVFTAISPVHTALGDGSPISVAAQDCYWADEGAHTGEVSPPLLKEAGCELVIIGHSERRARFHETDETVRQKLNAVLSHGLTPIVCVGETLEQREAGETEAIILGQLDGALEGLASADIPRLVIAYEPVWAIGTGKTASPEDAQAVHAAIRAHIGSRFEDSAAGRLRILYGGSVKPKNAADLLAQPDIDGALVGGASLTADNFIPIVEAAAS